MNSVNNAKNRLRKVIRQFFHQVGSGQLDPNREIAGQVLLGEVAFDPFHWLVCQPFQEKVYWRARDKKLTFAGAGNALQVRANSGEQVPGAFARISRILQHSTAELRFFGGIRFDSSVPPDRPWQDFPVLSFLLPRFMVITSGEKSKLVGNFILEPGGSPEGVKEAVLADLEKLELNPLPEFRPPTVLVRSKNVPDLSEWEQTIRHLRSYFHSNQLEKLVLAKKSVYTSESEVDPLNLFHRLKALNDRAFYFYFQPEPGRAFLGATPERLFRREGTAIFSEALAGTRPRGDSSRTDEQLEQELLKNEKEIAEHRKVSRHVAQVFERLCLKTEILQKEQVVKQTNVQHIFSSFRGKLKPGVGDWQILQALHPTPAVGGVPGKFARELIAELEPFDRGWYAAPIGWLGNRAAEFAVAIRSTLITANTVTLFAGAGIMPDSDPLAEWKETERKMLHFTKLLEKFIAV